ncbi:MAG: hypothetical protein J6O50_00590 [Ruminiclostridium sp.]|nr:hypothetical protein [Ruminiclostridium sp.]
MIVSCMAGLTVTAGAAWSGTGSGTADDPWLFGETTPGNITAVLSGDTLTKSGTGHMMSLDDSNP